MPIRPSKKDVRARYVEIPTELDAAFAASAKERGETYTGWLVQAMRRHLAYPPPVADDTPTPLPDAEPPPAKKSRQKGS